MKRQRGGTGTTIKQPLAAIRLGSSGYYEAERCHDQLLLTGCNQEVDKGLAESDREDETSKVLRIKRCFEWIV